MEGTKNDKAWNDLFNKYKILKKVEDHGTFEISSSQINEFREARLMTKFDYRSQLPDIFKKTGLSILPINRGTYVIGKFDIFSNFTDDDTKVISVGFPDYIKSIDFRNINSEAIALNCAYISGILSHFTGEEQILPTVCGRMGSSQFSFGLKDRGGRIINIEVNNAQIEIDGGYEGKNSLILIEAKNVISEDFVIRQLYYPYRAFRNKLNKEVRPIFVTYSNGIFHLREYEFENFLEYNSIKLVNSSSYSIVDGVVSNKLLTELLSSTPIREENKAIPFPQADDFSRIVNLCELIFENGPKSKEEISEGYGFVARQADYYSNAAIYLGLLEKDESKAKTFKLSKEGESIFRQNLYQRQIDIIKLIISHKPFSDCLSEYLRTGNMPDKDKVVSYMQATENINVESPNTFLRRAQSVTAWVNWIISLTGK